MKSPLLSIATLTMVLSAILLGRGSANELIVSLPALAQSTPPVTRELKSSPSLRDGLAQTEPIKITGVKISAKDNGIEISIENTPGTTFSQPFTQTLNQISTTDIPNAVLALPDGKEIRSDNPTPGVANILVTQISSTVVRVVITGTDKLPDSKVVTTDRGLVITSIPSPITAKEDDAELEINVVGLRNRRGYRLPNSSTATKTDTPLQDIPSNIQILPRKLLEDQGGVRIDDALRNVSGINYGNSFGGRISQFTGRGFAVTQFRNGFFEGGGSGALVGFNSRTSPEIADLERIEVLKGPASVLFGQVEPGAMVNLVSKKPLFSPLNSAAVTAGNFDFYRTTFDSSNALNPEKTLAYRVNIASESNNSFRNFLSGSRLSIAPSVTWKIDPKTNLTFEGSVLTDRRTIDRGLVALGTGVPNVPISRYLGPGTQPVEIDEKRAYLYFDREFNDNLAWRSTARITKSVELRPIAVQAGNLRPDNRTVPLNANALDQLYETYTWQNDLVAKLNTGSIKHTLLFGVDLNKISGWNYNNRASTTATTIDLFSPDYSRVQTPILLPAPQNDQTYDIKLLGIYLQDQVDLTDNLKLVLGGRYDGYEQNEVRTNNPSSALTLRQQGSNFSPRAGIVYQPTKAISLYGNYTNSFQPQIGKSLEGNAFVPERGNQYEIGVKADLIPGRLSATLAGYQISKTNVLTSDPRNVNFSIQVGEQQSRGIELDVTGEIMPGWDVIASYGYTNAEVTRDNRFAVGNRLVNIPANTGSLWTNYTFQQGSLQGFGVGAGVFFVDNRSGDLANSFTVPSYTRVDASVFYKTGQFKAALNFKNLLDSVSYVGTQSRSSIVPGAPFTVLGTLAYEF